MGKKKRKVAAPPAKKKRVAKKRRWGEVDMDEIRRQIEEFDTGDWPDIPWYNLDPGSHRLRILPPWREGRGPIAKIIYRHWNVPNPKDRTKNSSFICIEKTFPSEKIECPICSVIQEIIENTGEDMKQMMPGPRFNVNVVVKETRDSKGRKIELEDFEPTNVYVCSLAKTVHTWVLNQMDEPEIGNICHPENGYDIKIVRTGRGRTDTRYDPKLLPPSRPIFPDEEDIDEVEENMHDLDEIFSVPDEEYMDLVSTCATLLERKFTTPEAEYEYDDDEEVEGAEYEDEEEEAPPPKSRAIRKRKKKTKKAAEEAEDDEPSYEDEVTAEELEEGESPLDPEEDEAKRDDEPDEETEAEEEDEEGGEDEGEEEGEDEEEEEESPSKGKKLTPAMVKTPEDAVRFLKIKPLTDDNVVESIESGSPKCYAQYAKVGRKFREVCRVCAYEFSCAEDSGLELFD